MLMRGKRLYAQDPVAAIRNVRNSLQLDPSLDAARQTLREWEKSTARP